MRTQIDKTMTDRYGAVPTQTEHKLIGRCPIDIGAVPKTETNMEMADQYKCDPKNANSN